MCVCWRMKLLNKKMETKKNPFCGILPSLCFLLKGAAEAHCKANWDPTPVRSSCPHHYTASRMASRQSEMDVCSEGTCYALAVAHDKQGKRGHIGQAATLKNQNKKVNFLKKERFRK